MYRFPPEAWPDAVLCSKDCPKQIALRWCCATCYIIALLARPSHERGFLVFAWCDTFHLRLLCLGDPSSPLLVHDTSPRNGFARMDRASFFLLRLLHLIGQQGRTIKQHSGLRVQLFDTALIRLIRRGDSNTPAACNFTPSSPDFVKKNAISRLC